MGRDAGGRGRRQLSSHESGHLRRAGSGRLPWGGRVTWTVADGTRGRRWRSVLVDGTGVVGTLLLETTPEGAFAKLELATAAGLLTLHPEASGLHGNVVRPAGIEHVTLPWSADALVLVEGTPATAAAAARMLGPHVGVGEELVRGGVSVDVELVLRQVTFKAHRLAADRWRFVPADGGVETTVDLDEDGIPVLTAGATWALEQSHDA